MMEMFSRMGLFLCYIAVRYWLGRETKGPADLTNVLLFLDQRKSDLGRVGTRERKQEPVTGKEESSEQVREIYMDLTSHNYVLDLCLDCEIRTFSESVL